MTKDQAKKLVKGDRIRIKQSAPIDPGCLGTVMARMSNGIWVKLDDGQQYTIPWREIELAPVVQP